MVEKFKKSPHEVEIEAAAEYLEYLMKCLPNIPKDEFNTELLVAREYITGLGTDKVLAEIEKRIKVVTGSSTEAAFLRLNQSFAEETTRAVLAGASQDTLGAIVKRQTEGSVSTGIGQLQMAAPLLLAKGVLLTWRAEAEMNFAKG